MFRSFEYLVLSHLAITKAVVHPQFAPAVEIHDEVSVPPLFLLLIPADRYRQFQEMWYPNQQPSEWQPCCHSK